MTINYAQVERENARAKVDELTPYVNVLRQAEANLVGEIAAMGNPATLSRRDESRRMQLQQALTVLRGIVPEGQVAGTVLGAGFTIQDVLQAAGVEIDFEPRVWWSLRQAERMLDAAEAEVARVA